MYDPTKSLAAATAQDLWTALLLKRRFNQFEPERIVQDLYAQPQLWQKFWLGWLTFDIEFYQDTREAPITRLLEMLVYAQDERLHKNDVLYIQSADDEFVPALLGFAKQWQADDCQVYDRAQLAEILGRMTLLKEVIEPEKMERHIDRWKTRQSCAPVLAMWWD
ncbi:hypothetical protein H6F89_29420 [Cyanobacteria bacterium FACHB-63]|nr:hypothetical protein [Cyanobacteria bacterium FACHB-63]